MDDDAQRVRQDRDGRWAGGEEACIRWEGAKEVEEEVDDGEVGGGVTTGYTEGPRLVGVGPQIKSFMKEGGRALIKVICERGWGQSTN